MKYLFFITFLMLNFTKISASDDVVGYWKTIDEKSGKPRSLIAIYEYQGKIFGRIILTYNDQGEVEDTIYNAKDKAPGIVGNPPYVGLDIIYDLQKKGDKYADGEIIDPEKGRIYGAEIWREGTNLKVRGKVLFLGRNQTWIAANEKDFPSNFKKVNLEQLVPSIPKIKD